MCTSIRGTSFSQHGVCFLPMSCVVLTRSDILENYLELALEPVFQATGTGWRVYGLRDSLVLLFEER